MYDFDRIVKAAESCEFHSAFASDIISAVCRHDSALNIDVPAAFRRVRAIHI